MTSLSYKALLNTYLEHFKTNPTFMMLIHTVLFYIGMGLFITIYYSFWGIDAEKYLNVSSVIDHTLQNPFSAFNCLFLVIASLVTFINIKDFWGMSSDKRLFLLRNRKPLLLSLLILLFLLILLTFVNLKNALNYRELIDFRRGYYNPVSVQYSGGSLLCVKSIGNVGRYNLFAHPGGDRYLVPTDDILMVSKVLKEKYIPSISNILPFTSADIDPIENEPYVEELLAKCGVSTS
ncbi:MAG: hypothetical protein CL577_07555 [Alteromonadaceae bacterium]|jgi:hypothetical protein|uniref:hypothetical protein n=3 Tax=Rheinheimera aquimaris TaxID=412437 RepID=UPI000C381550|nr:hypothetical protein [Rheinheimera aquimaris]MBJ92443.1 hypothetical protein [Alteromonadaceae bacterium]HBN90789.1 hypothetical protein [Rheinheimera sp.]